VHGGYRISIFVVIILNYIEYNNMRLLLIKEVNERLMLKKCFSDILTLLQISFATKWRRTEGNLLCETEV
jgi:hypothetical protein